MPHCVCLELLQKSPYLGIEFTYQSRLSFLRSRCKRTATAVAMFLGAPFWFDILDKIMVVRSTVKPREKSHDEGSLGRLLMQILVHSLNPNKLGDHGIDLIRYFDWREVARS